MESLLRFGSSLLLLPAFWTQDNSAESFCQRQPLAAKIAPAPRDATILVEMTRPRNQFPVVRAGALRPVADPFPAGRGEAKLGGAEGVALLVRYHRFEEMDDGVEYCLNRGGRAVEERAVVWRRDR